MPNWVYNTLDIHADQDTIDQIAVAVANEPDFIAHFIPFPENGHRHIITNEGADNEQRCSVFAKPSDGDEGEFIDGYAWCCDNWGTKWGACSTDITDQVPGRLSLSFDTAWGIADKGLRAISTMFPTAVFVLLAVEEQPAWRVRCVYENGSELCKEDDLRILGDGIDFSEDKVRAEEYWEIVSEEIDRTVLRADGGREWELSPNTIHRMACEGSAAYDALNA